MGDRLALFLGTAVSLGVAGFMFRYALRRQSLTVIVWGLTVINASVIGIEGTIAPVYLPFGHTVHVADAHVISRAAMFVAFFSAFMAASQVLIMQVLPFPKNRGFLLRPDSYPNRLALVVGPLTAVMLIAGVLYIARVLAYATFQDRYRDASSNWEMVIYVACWSVVPLAVIYDRKRVAAVAAVLSAIVVGVSQVRYMALFYIIPLLLLLWVKYAEAHPESPWRSIARDLQARVTRRGRAVLLVLSVGVVVAGIYLGYARGGGRIEHNSEFRSTRLPEVWLTRGFYRIMDVMESGRERTGWTSYERLAAGVLYPYLRYFTEYEYPVDPPVYFARIVGGFSADDIETWPFLIYSDSYAGFGFAGCLLGFLWGGIYALADFAITRRRVFVFMFPWAVWFMYMSYRGAVSNTILSIPREFYLNVAAIAMLGWRFPVRGSRNTAAGDMRLSKASYDTAAVERVCA